MSNQNKSSIKINTPNILKHGDLTFDTTEHALFSRSKTLNLCHIKKTFPCEKLQVSSMLYFSWQGRVLDKLLPENEWTSKTGSTQIREICKIFQRSQNSW